MITIPFFNCSRHLKKDIALLDYSYDYDDSHDCDNVLIGYRNSIIFYDNQKFTIYSHRSSRGNRIINEGALDSTTFAELQKYWTECQGDSVKDYYKPEDLKKNEVCQELTIHYGNERKVIIFCEKDNNLPLCIREIIKISTSPLITDNLVNSPPLLTYSYGGNDHEITYNKDCTFTAYSQTTSRGKNKWISNKGTLDSTTFGDLQKYLAECQDDSVKIYYRPEDPQFDDTWQELNIYSRQKRKTITFCERDKNLPFCIREIIRISTSPTIITSLVNYPSFSIKNLLTYSYSNDFMRYHSSITYKDDRTFDSYRCKSSRGKEKCKSIMGKLDSTTFGKLQKNWADCLDDSIKSSYKPDVLAEDEGWVDLTFYYGQERKSIRIIDRDIDLPACIRGILSINASPE